MEDNGSKSLISKEMKITGTIESSGSLQIDGKLDGEINCAGDALVGKDAQIKGNIDANAVTVSGTVNGNITAKDKIDMKSSAKVTGDIRAKRLSVEDGVSFVGKSEVNPSGTSAPQQPQPEKTPDSSGQSTDSSESKGKGIGGMLGNKR